MFIQFLILGLGASAVYALLGQGIVLVFRGSGIVNLAHGTQAMLGAYIFGLLRAQQGWSTVSALLAAVVTVTAVGVAVDQLLLRRLRHASALARLIATLGVFLILYAVAEIFWQNEEVVITPIFPSGTVSILGTKLPQDRLWTFGLAAVLTAALTLCWRYTKAGWLTDAVAENELHVASLGWSPRLISTGTWVAGSALAGLAGALMSPFTQLSISSLSLLLIPGLAAALIGGFRSFPLTLLGGVIVGVAQSEAGNYVHITGAADALPFALIVVVVLVRGASLPLRGHLFDRLPTIGTGRVDPLYVGIAALICALVAIFLTSPTWLSAVTGTFAVGIILLSLVVLTGYAGQVSLAQYALAGIGALVAAQLVAAAHWPFFIAVVLGVATATVVGFLFALPALRTRGINLAIVTLGLGVATQALIFNNADYTGGISGVVVDQPTLFGWSIGTLEHPGRYAAVTMAVFGVAALGVANVRRSRVGRRLLALRSNERAAAAVGINVYSCKLYAFAVSGALAGLGGIALAFTAETIVFTQFSPLNSITAVSDVVIGGVGFVFGAFTGAQLAPGSIGSVVQLHWQSLDLYLPLIGGIGLIVTLLVAPNGNVHQLIDGLSQRRVVKRRAGMRPVKVDRAAPTLRVEPKTLTVEKLAVRYGGVVAVNDVSLTVRPGQIVALIGPNGAGKTSLTDAVSGFTSAKGRVLLDDLVISDLPPHERARAGLVRSFQALELFDGMTVLENLLAASEPQDLTGMITAPFAPREPTLSGVPAAAAREFGLLDTLSRQASQLSFGDRKLVAIARAVACHPSVLILDEPVSGLDSDQTARFGTLVRRLADVWGMAVLVIEHDMNFVMSVSDRVVVINFGTQIAAGTTDEIASDPAAITAYLGDSLDGAEANAAAGHSAEM